MTTVGIIILLVAVIIFIKDHKTKSSLWLSGVFFLLGLGTLVVVFETYFRIYLIPKYKLTQNTVDLVYHIAAVYMSLDYFLTPYGILVYGLLHTNIFNKYKKKIIYFVLFLPPFLNFVLVPIKSNFMKTPLERMTYFKILSTWSVTYIFAGIIFLIYSYFKEKSYLMKKYKFKSLLILVPCFLYLALSTILFRALGIENSWEIYSIIMPIMFLGFLYFSFKYGIFGVRFKFTKYNFAFENIMDFVSDSILTLDKNLNVIEFNNEFRKSFLLEDKKYKNFKEIISSSKISKYKDRLINIINESKINNIKAVEILIKTNNGIKYFAVQANPVILYDEYHGTVLVFKDISVHKKNLRLIKENQMQLIEKERLLSLNQLIGGVAHNLKTPLMSSAGGIEIIKRDIERINQYTKDNSQNDINIRKTIDEVNKWSDRITENLIYISNVIDVVKGQVTPYDKDNEDYFTIKEIEKKIMILMDFQIRKSKCKFIKKINIERNIKIKGDINSLVQVLNNLISNAIESVSVKENGTVIFGIYKEINNVIFYIKNNGDKIPENVQKKIFKKMITTKGKNGTGLGLYISKLIVKVMFEGKIYFNTGDEETIFYVEIPLKDMEG
ncbi:ATP-binding protein [Clostridium pasteurianum]|uniref:histidine kinase n=1 Tax=Clostridium pasteurianum BC1 TaxID=86416 RepID=R4JZU1_CLOPA|nr:ATP-binding protein [Clostridium pasteurianum]AGK96362.1 signal transduction histidine kinase [Clostridium pasteurianum BC1]